MKKIISILLVVSMLFSLSVTVFAAGTEENVLRFRKNGTFKILVLADVQDVYPIDDAMISFINEALDYAKPDLVVFDGDNIVTEDVRAYEQLLYPLVSRNVPFTFVFGNHDVERENFTAEQQLAEYQKYPGCLAFDADPALHGCANHNLLIYSSKGNDIAFNLWMFDSGTSLHDENGEWLGYDWVRADQIEWYNKLVMLLQKQMVVKLFLQLHSSTLFQKKQLKFFSTDQMFLWVNLLIISMMAAFIHIFRKLRLLMVIFLKRVARVTVQMVNGTQ